MVILFDMWRKLSGVDMCPSYKKQAKGLLGVSEDSLQDIDLEN